ncbi:hypothetical protein [Mycolicibacterium palauense]|uniref:hypothetical protein n=1 Tax=Mycolicibacterium palauense TaxID=2034511 RepID=UPI001FE5C6DB|nr:hypothetical protein [Mycolicibacterium palauense]
MNQMCSVAAASVMVAGILTAPQAAAGPQTCNDAFCVPGITPNVVLGDYCANPNYFVFGTAVAGPSIQPGRLLFCGSPRRYAPRWFRSPPIAGIRDENSSCDGSLHMVAQAPDGLFLSCIPVNGASLWRRGDALSNPN